jgi:hypothetical protein
LPGKRAVLALLVALAALAPSADSAVFHRRSFRRSGGLSLRRRLFTSPLITDPGNLDLEWSGAFDTNGSWALPQTWKWTPSGEGAYIGHTEFSLGYDSLVNVDETGDRDIHFSDHLNLAATTLLGRFVGVDVAVAPTASFFLRGESGARLGGALLTRWDRKNWSVSSAASWTGATVSSDTNPAGTGDLVTGLGRQFGKWTLYSNLQWERSTGAPWTLSVFEGVEYQFTERFALDVSGQHYSLSNGTHDHQVVAGMVWTVWHKH